MSSSLCNLSVTGAVFKGSVNPWWSCHGCLPIWICLLYLPFACVALSPAATCTLHISFAYRQAKWLDNNWVMSNKLNQSSNKHMHTLGCHVKTTRTLQHHTIQCVTAPLCHFKKFGQASITPCQSDLVTQTLLFLRQKSLVIWSVSSKVVLYILTLTSQFGKQNTPSKDWTPLPSGRQRLITPVSTTQIKKKLNICKLKKVNKINNQSYLNKPLTIKMINI